MNVKLAFSTLLVLATVPAALVVQAAGMEATAVLKRADAAPPSPANANNVNLVANIERLKLSVERILPLHGRIVPLAELHRTIGR